MGWASGGVGEPFGGMTVGGRPEEEERPEKELEEDTKEEGDEGEDEEGGGGEVGDCWWEMVAGDGHPDEGRGAKGGREEGRDG